MFNGIDIIVLVLVVIGTLLGLKRRLSGEIARLVSILITILVAFLAYRPMGEWLVEHTRLSQNPEAALALSYTLVLIGMLIFMLIVRWMLRKLMQVTFNKKADVVGGAIAGFLRSALFAMLMITAVGLWPHSYMHRVVAEESFCGRVVFDSVLPGMARLFGRTPEDFGNEGIVHNRVKEDG